MDTPQLELDVSSTLESGQTFSWQRGRSGCYWSVIEGQTVAACPGKVPDWDSAYDYFRLGDDLPTIYGEIGRDEFMRKAISSLEGMRIVKADPWETSLSFMASAHNSVREIRASLLRMRQALGSRAAGKSTQEELGYELRAFPTPSQVTMVSVEQMIDFGFGFRSKNMLEFAASVERGDFDPYSLGGLGYDRAREALMDVKGIGPKIADCILLFSLGYLQAFPVDVWIRKVVSRVYLGKDDENEERVRRFGTSYFGRYAGYAQEYIYAYSRGVRGQGPGPSP